MDDFKAGDDVILNHGQVATLTFFDRGLDRFTAEVRVGGAIDTISGHITNTHFRAISGEVASVAQDPRELVPQRDPQGNVGPLDEPFQDAHDSTGQRVELNFVPELNEEPKSEAELAELDAEGEGLEESEDSE